MKKTLTTRVTNGTFYNVYEEHYDNNLTYRLTTFNNDVTEDVDINGKLHNENGPARMFYIIRYDKLILLNENYYIDGEAHRENKPAVIWYYNNGNTKIESFLIKGKMHRDNDLPAYIKYYENGSIKSEQYYFNGNPHRNNNPAGIYYNEDGSISFEEYWINGTHIPKNVMKENPNIIYDKNLQKILL